MAGEGLVSMTPTSITHAGTSASINADGGVDFTAITSLSLDGVFTSDYDNYLIVMESSSSTNTLLDSQLRASGSSASASNYTRQFLAANGTSVTAARAASETFTRFGYLASAQRNGRQIHVYGPALAEPTAFRSNEGTGYLNAFLSDYASTHSLSTSYDGILFAVSTGNITGNVHVFGYEE